MGRIIVSDNLSIDGVIQDPAGDEGFERGGWVGAIKDRPELGQLALDDALGSDAMLMGRRTYEWFAGRWPSRTRRARGPAERHAQVRRLVDPRATPPGTTPRCSRATCSTRSRGLKRRISRDILVTASSRIALTLLEHDLVDELRLKVFPVVLGAGQRLFGETSAMKRDAARRRPVHRRRHRLPHLRAKGLSDMDTTMTDTSSRHPRRVARRPRGAARPREGAHAAGRRAGARAPRPPLGAGRAGLPLRHRGRRADAGRAVRRSLAAPRLPLHVRAELRGRRRGELVDRRHDRRRSSRTSMPAT